MEYFTEHYQKQQKINLNMVKNNLHLFEGGLAMNGYEILREKILFPTTKSKLANLYTCNDNHNGYAEAHVSDFECISPMI